MTVIPNEVGPLPTGKCGQNGTNGPQMTYLYREEMKKLPAQKAKECWFWAFSPSTDADTSISGTLVGRLLSLSQTTAKNRSTYQQQSSQQICHVINSLKEFALGKTKSTSEASNID
jgi:hypothetical protein